MGSLSIEWESGYVNLWPPCGKCKLGGRKEIKRNKVHDDGARTSSLPPALPFEVSQLHPGLGKIKSRHLM